MKKITFVLLLLSSGLTGGFAQSENISNGKVQAKATGTFYDDGGPFNNHGSNKSFTQTFQAAAGQNLTFTFTEFDLGINDYLYIYDGASTSSNLIGVYARTASPGTIKTSEAGGSLTFQFTSDNSSSANGTGWAAKYATGGPNQIMTGENCANANPFCTGTNYNFPNSTGVQSLGGGGIYGCLGSTPNPVWYYMQVATAGNIDITINQVSNGGTPIDVDFIAWGPFTSLAQGCGSLSTSNDVDCSYSTSATEICNIPNAQVGQFYILLMTNFNGAAGHISFSQTGGAGSTNCSILCSTVANTGPVCQGGTFNLTATSVSNATAYNWTGPGGFASSQQNPIGVTAPNTVGANTYTLVVTTPTGTCTAQTTVTVKQTPVANAGTTSVITCAQPNALLDGSSDMGSATLTWNGPGASNTADPFNATQAGTYTLTATNQGCSTTATIAVTSNTVAPVPSFTTPDGTVLNCITQAVTLNGSATPSGATVAWTGQAGNPISVSAPGTYTLVATDPANGCTAQTTVTVTANAGPPNISVSNSPNTTVINCNDSAIVLTGSTTTPNTVDGWTGPSGGIIGNPITVTAPGLYTYQVIDNNNGCVSSSAVNITLDTLSPAIQISAPNTIITCAQTSVALAGTSTTANTSFAWSEDSIGVAGNPITVSDSGTYVLVVTNNTNGCTSTMSQLITKDLTAPNAAINAPNTTLTCVVTSVSLQGTSTTTGATFAWDGPTGTSTNNPLATSTPGTYTLTVTNPTNGCTSTQTVLVTEDITQPDVSYTTPQGTVIDCNTPTVQLQGSSTVGTATLVWSGVSGNIPNNPATVGSPGSYTITATNPSNGCLRTDSVTVTANGSLPNISYTSSAPNITCAVTSVTLTGASTTPGVTISWASSAGPVGNPYTANASGSYTLTVTDGGTGCTATSIAAIGMDTIRPNESIFASVTTLTCASPSSTLTGASTTPGATYSWSGPSGAIAGNPVTANVSGTYSLTVTSPANGCTRTQTVGITTNTVAPTVSIASNTTQLTCSTTSIPLTATGNPSNVNYSWSGMGVGSNSTINATNPGTYVVSVIDPANGCSGNTSVNITQNITAPPVTAGGGGPLNCNGAAIPLTGSSSLSGVTFVWTGPSQFVDSTANSSTTTVGNYTLSVTNPANGCVGTGVVSVTTNTQVPNVNAGLNQIVKCNKTSAILTGSSSTPNTTFSWAGPAGATILPNTTTAVCTTSVASNYALAAGNYTLTVTNQSTGCIATDVVLVTSTPAPNAGFTATPVEGYVPLAVNFTNTSTNSNTYSWNFDHTGVATTLNPTPAVASTANPSTTFNEGGTYEVMMITSVNGACKDTAYITIEVKEPTEVVIPNIFSPNNDGSNDAFYPTTMKAVSELTIDIWDRWGKHVKTFDGKNGQWDGKSDGKECSDGTYFYIAKGKGTDKSEIEQTGFILLVRLK